MSNAPTKTEKTDTLETVIGEILDAIEQDREKEIITRRFGLFDRKETLEQIGELLGITRERVRQLEKAILIRLKMAAEDGRIPSIQRYEKKIITALTELGRVARVQDLTGRLDENANDTPSRSRLTFIAELSPNLTPLNENDNYHQSVGIAEYGNEKELRSKVDSIVKAIKKHGEPVTPSELHEKLSFEHPSQIEALASTSKLLANLGDHWGLSKWPTVNPKNIRDKIYVVLADNKKPMHFSEIADSIKQSDFKRKDVTTQAIHNELIKDPRFVLIGRGIYALDSWGYKQGTVSDIIEDILRKSETPLHRDEIVKQVLESRQVKETTVLLNLQSKPQFKRVAKATYTFVDPETK